MNHKKPMNRRKLTVVSLVAVPLVAAGGVVVAESAFAGTNGQTIQLCQPNSDYRSASLRGTNENNEVAQTNVHDLTRECSTVAGYAWKGGVHIIWSDSPSSAQGTPSEPGVPFNFGTDCDVPVNSNQDPYVCSGPKTLPPQG
jgi:hypothetical protein